MVQALIRAFAVGILFALLCGAQPDTSVNDSGTWRDIDQIHVNDSSTWRRIKRAWVNDSGTWRLFHVGLLLQDASLTCTGGAGAAIRLQAAGLDLKGVSGCSSFVAQTDQWGGDGAESGLAPNYQARLTNTSGTCSVDSEFQLFNVWYDLQDINPTQWSGIPSNCSGTWTLEIRDDTTLNVKAVAVYTISQSL